MPQPQFAYPNSSFGYWRGGMSDGPFWKGQGSRQGPAAQGAGLLPPGSGAPSAGGWHPTVIWMLGMVVAEMVIFKILERMLR